MSKNKKVIIGVCRVCLRKSQLTFEHIPPKSAFNNNKYFYTTNVHPLLEKKDAKTFEDLTSFDKKKQRRIKEVLDCFHFVSLVIIFLEFGILVRLKNGLTSQLNSLKQIQN